MEILFISHKYPPSVGGMEKQSYELITRSSKYAKVHTILWIKGEEPKWKFFLNLKKRIKKKLKECKGIDAIHLNDGLMAMMCHWLPEYTSVPVMVTLHGLDVVYPLPIFQQKVKKYYSKFSKLITVSEATKQALIIRGLPPEKIVTIHNGVDHSMVESKESKGILQDYIGQKLEEDSLILVGIGRQVKRKGFSWFLKRVIPYVDDSVVFILIGPRLKSNFLFRLLRKLFPKRMLIFLDLLIGYPSDQDDVTQIITSSDHMNGKVFHLSDCKYQDVMNILSLADVMVMPNIKVDGDAEGFGLVALEASINGTPVLASRIEGIKDAVNEGKNGWLIPSGDQLRWVNKINRLAEDKNMIKKAGERARIFTMMNFSWDKMVLGYLEEIEKLKSKSGIRKYNYRIKPKSLAV